MSAPISAWFIDRKVATKISALILVVVAVVSGVSSAGLYALNTAHGQANQMHDEYLVSLDTLNGFRQNLLELYANMAMIGVVDSAVDGRRYAERVDAAAKEIKALANKYRSLMEERNATQEERQLFVAMDQPLLQAQTALNEQLMPALAAISWATSPRPCGSPASRCCATSSPGSTTSSRTSAARSTPPRPNWRPRTAGI